MRAKCWRLTTVWAVLALPLALRAAELSASKAAERIDNVLAKEIAAAAEGGSAAWQSGEAIDDEAFLRRVTLDLVGQPPTPSEITRFALDTSPDKRAKLVDRLLADPRYGENWGRYWRDVFLYRRTDDRALMAAASGQRYLADSLNAGKPWNEIARELVTATGSLSEDGRTVLLASQWGETPDTAAEVSRVLLGVQIQCAQCHDHPTDRWKRAEFHEFAAFFPRTAIRPIRDGEKRVGFELVSREGGRRPGKKGKPNPAEHYMPDLADPSAKGTLMSPKFFVSGETLAIGTSDAERREQLARMITAEKNPWFAKAVVNRMWSELVGEGFYEPIDDLGPDRSCSAPQTLELLSKQFVAHDYDLRWLLRTIVLTDAYERRSRPRRNPDEPPFVANCWQPLRADALFDSVAQALGFSEPPLSPDELARPQRALRSPRALFNAAFGYDPSDPRDEVDQSIPQALILMNGPQIQKAINGRTDRTALGKLLKEESDDRAVVEEIYLRTLARQPSEEETATAMEYVSQVGNRVEAFEDLQWALLNSTEFLYRN